MIEGTLAKPSSVFPTTSENTSSSTFCIASFSSLISRAEAKEENLSLNNGKI